MLESIQNRVFAGAGIKPFPYPHQGVLYVSRCNFYKEELEDEVLMVLGANHHLNSLSRLCQCYHLRALSVAGLKLCLLLRY